MFGYLFIMQFNQSSLSQLVSQRTVSVVMDFFEKYEVLNVFIGNCVYL